MILLAVIGLALGRVVRNPFVSYDDPEYVVLNPLVRTGLTLAGVGAASKADCVGNWHPLTTLSHMLDVQLFGLAPAGHHLTSLAMHTISAVLLMLVLARATGQLRRSTLVAALFAVHPLHVESVAWVAERKDVLCGLIWVLTIWCHLRYVARPAPIRYAAVVCLCTLALLAKPMAVTLPFTLLLIDFWPLQRMASERNDQPGHFGAIFLEKLPLMVLSVVAGAATIYTQRTAGLMASVQRNPLSGRISTAIVAYAMYLLKMIWPRDLAVFYPLPAGWPLWQVLACAEVLLAMSLCAILLVRPAPYLLMGWLWYLGTLVPVIGLVQVGDQSMADRYTYIPSIGIFIAVCWSAGDLLERLPRLRPVGDMAAVAAVVSCVLLTWRQVGFWSSSDSLFRHALAVTRDNYVAENNLANVLMRSGRGQEAEQHYLAAVRIRPTDAVTQNNLANVLAKKGELDLAADHYRAAIAASPDFTEAHYNFGVILKRQGRLDEAIEQFRAAVKSSPDVPEFQRMLASALAEKQPSK